VDRRLRRLGLGAVATAAQPRRAWIDRPFNGPGRCNWCGRVVDDPRCRWCSESCRDEFWCRASQSYARELVARRDHGVCSTCGTDTRRQRAAYVRLCTWGEAGRWFSVRHYPRIARQAQQKYGIPRGRLNNEWWDMDHIVPIVEGGSRGLSNLRTLCIPCHREETRALGARRAQARRATGTDS
jgi:5-methylcytosine-specific restriction protein A